MKVKTVAENRCALSKSLAKLMRSLVIFNNEKNAIIQTLINYIMSICYVILHGSSG